MKKNKYLKYLKRMALAILIGFLGILLFYLFIFFYGFVYESYKYNKGMDKIENIGIKDLKIALIKEEDKCIRYEIMVKLGILKDDENMLAKEYCLLYNK